jgi:arsenite-transporting ATPase
VDQAENEVVIIDTAPTGHTLLLLDSTQSYHKEVERTKGEIPISVQRLLPRLRDEKQTEVVIVTLPEATPVYEAERLKDDLQRAGINNRWWVVNQCLSFVDTTNPILSARAESEKEWIQKVNEISNDHTAAIAWSKDSSVQELQKAVAGGERNE